MSDRNIADLADDLLRLRIDDMQDRVGRIGLQYPNLGQSLGRDQLGQQSRREHQAAVRSPNSRIHLLDPPLVRNRSSPLIPGHSSPHSGCELEQCVDDGIRPMRRQIVTGAVNDALIDEIRKRACQTRCRAGWTSTQTGCTGT